MLALPQRSPYPLIVACTWRIPACTAAIEFATASSASLWVWIPQVTAGASGSASSAARVSPTIRSRSSVSVPPFVSHSTRLRAPAWRAARRVASAYPASARYPSK